MVNVLLVSPLFPPNIGGIQTFMENFAHHTSHNVHVLTVKREDSKQDNFDFSITRTDLLSVEGTANFARFLLENRHNFDMVYFSRLTRKPFELIASLFYPTISYAYGSELLEPHLTVDPKFMLHKIRTSWRKLFFRVGLRRIDEFIAMSSWTERQLLDLGIEQEQISIIHSGVDFAHFSGGDCDNADTVSDCNKTTLMTVSRLDPRKGHAIVLRAIKELADFEYVIVGDGPEREHLKNLSEKLGIQDRVRFLGFVDGEILPDIYDCCDIFIMMGDPNAPGVEGFGNAYLEANAAGKPVIGSNIEGVPSAINHGETGFLISPEITEVKRILTKISEGDVINSTMEKQCIEWARTHDWSNIVSQIDEKIEECYQEHQ